MQEEDEDLSREAGVLQEAVVDLIKSNCELMEVITQLTEHTTIRSKSLIQRIRDAHLLYAKAKSSLKELKFIDESLIQ